MGGTKCNRNYTVKLAGESVLNVLKIAFIALTVAAAATSTSARADDCPRPDTLGTSRILTVDPATYPRVGLQSFPQTLPLADKEVVLTFDDGPNPPTTKKILDALAKECVKATFFQIGENAARNGELLRAMAAAGHTLGHHSWAHPNLGHIANAAAIDQIDHGISADEMALHGHATTVPTTPFFRFPYFESTPALLDMLQSRGIAVFGADLWASDWNKMTPDQELTLITGRLQAAGKGIILFHDTKAQTAAMMPDFLRYLRENHYHIVHIVPVDRNKIVSQKAAP